MKKKKLWQLCLQLTCLTLAHEGFSLPKDHQVASGSAEFKQLDASTMEIHPSDQAIINYSRFDIGSQEKVRFVQNSNSSCVLNRVVGNDPSQIFGSLESNGKVFLVNPNGVYFGPESTVNVGSFIASTLDIADEDFLAENYHFSLTKNSEIRNEGFLSSIEGSIVLMAPQIRNLGSIEAKAGTVLLASGGHITLDFVGDGLVKFAVEGSLKEALIEHLGHIKGSIVSLKLPTAKKAIQEIVNLDGMQEGDVFVEENGLIKFVAGSTLLAQNTHLEGSQISIEGSITGNEVRLLGKDIVLQGAQIDVSSPTGAGKVLIGGEYQGKGTTPYAQTVTMDESSTILANALENGDGGLVVLWSKDRTIFNGAIEAHGGPLGGDGGLIETSSINQLGVGTGRAGALAPKGKTGDWLLDPQYAYIVAAITTTCAETTGVSTITWGDCTTSGTCYINAFSIQAASLNVIVDATDTVSLIAGTDLFMGVDNVGITLGGCPTSTVVVGGNITTKSGAVNLLGSVVQMDGVPTIIDTTQPLTTAPNVPSAGADIYCLNLERSGAGVGLASVSINAGGSGTVTIGTNGSYAADVTVSNAYQIKTPGIQLENAGSLSLTAVNGVLATGSTTTLSAIGPVTVNTTIDAQDGGNYNLSIFTGIQSGIPSVANVTIEGAIGGTSPLANVSISSTGTASFNSITTKTNGAINVSPPAIINETSVITSNNGAIIFLSTISDESPGVGSIEFIAGTGLITFTDDVGAFGTFTVTTASAVDLGGSITAYDLVSITPNIVLTGTSAIEILATAGDVSLAGVSSSTTQNFTCVSLGATTVGALGGLGAVDIEGDTINLTGAIAATSLALLNSGTLIMHVGTITLNGGAFSQSGGDVTLTTTAINSGGGNVSFVGALSPSIAGTSNLTINAGTTGLVTLGEQVGSVSDAFGSVTLSAASGVDLGSSMYAANAVSVTPDISLTGDSTIAATIGSVSLAGVSSTNGYSFTGSAGTTISVGALSSLGNISLAGTAVTLGGAVTNSIGLTISDSTSLSIIAGDIDITGSFVESGGGTVALGNDITAGGGISFEDPIALNAAGRVSLTAASSPGIILSSDITGAGSGYNLTLISYTYGFDVANLGTSGDPLGNVSLYSNVDSSFSGIAATGRVVVNAPIVLIADTTVQTVDGGSASYSFVFNDTVDSTSGTHYAFNITAAATPVSLNADLGYTTSLGAVTVSGSNLSLGASIDTYGGIVTLNPSVLLTAASTIDTTFESALGANIIFGSTVDGDESLILKAGSVGTITFGGAVGGNPALASLFIEFASLVNIKDITTTGDITIDPNIILSNALTAIESTENGAISLGDIDGAESLTVTTGGYVTLGLIGSSVPLGDVTVTSPSAIIQSITATGTVDLLDTMATLAASSTITGAIIELGMVDSKSDQYYDLTLTGGAVTLEGELGGQRPLGQVIITGSSLDLDSSIYTHGQSITIGPAIILSADSTLDTTDSSNAPSGADIIIEDTVNGDSNFTLIAGTSGDITFSGVVGGTAALASLSVTSASTVNIENVTTTGDIAISPDIILSEALTTFTSNSGGSVALGAIDGTALGSQSLTVSTTGATSLGVIGDTTPLVNVIVLTGTKATIHSILVSGNITIDIPIVLAASATLNTTENGSTGSTVTFQTINGTTVGGESLTIVAGTTGAVVFEGDIGSSSIGNPIGALDVTGTLITFDGSTVVTKGSETYHGPVLISQDITFTSLGNIIFDSTVSPVSGTPSLTFYPGSGALTFVGAVASFDDIIVYNAGSFSSQAITANALVVSGGLPSIYINGTVTLGTPGAFILDGGPIYLGGEIDAAFIWLHAQGNISNIGSPQPINVSGSTLRAFETFNAVGGIIGSFSSPIEINTSYSLLVGASPRADFSGTPNHTQVKEFPSNPPCIVTFNGATIINGCVTPTINRFLFLPKYLFYVPGLYSSWDWDNLSNRWYFEEEPWALGANPRDTKLTYWTSSRVSKEEKVHRTLQKSQKKQPKKTSQKAPMPQPVVPQATVNVEIITPTPTKQEPEKELELDKTSKVSIKESAPLPIPVDVEQKEEEADWGFTLDFGKEVRPLDMLPDSKNK